jgi:hypothetical protein
MAVRYVIPKGAADESAEGIAILPPFARERVGELSNRSDIKLLTVCVDRLRRWYRPELLCIGDAARHVPDGGVRINLAVRCHRGGQHPGFLLLKGLSPPITFAVRGGGATDHLRKGAGVPHRVSAG